LRFVNVCLVLALGALAYVIYEVKYEARALDEKIAVLQKDIEAERDGVAVLRAEWSLLNRPERIERLALKYLKLGPARPSQLVTLDTVSESDFERARVIAADQTVPAVLPGVAAKPVAAIGAKAEPGKVQPARAEPSKTRPAKVVALEAGAAGSTAILPPVTVSAPGE
jgi:cell division protein FtsL